MKGFFKVHRDRLEELFPFPMTMHLLLVIAYRANRTGLSDNDLGIGECYVGDFRKFSMSEQQYRTAKKKLSDMGFVTFTAYNKGTVAKLVDCSVFDPNFYDLGNGQDNGQTNSQGNGQKNTQITDKESYETPVFSIVSNDIKNTANGQKYIDVTDKITDRITVKVTTNKEDIKNDKEKRNIRGKKIAANPPDLFGEKPEKNCLFKNSPVYELEKFKKEFVAPEFSKVDIEYYYHAVKDWSSGSSKKRTDWIAVARTFMRGDQAEGKLKLIITEDMGSKFANGVERLRTRYPGII